MIIVNQQKTLRGMTDLLPDQIVIWQKVEEIIRNELFKAGFQEIRTPLLEATDLFKRGIGEATDVVGKEMYTFLDRGDRSCTLRPEGTASVVRAAIEHGLIKKGIQRLWYQGPMFRYERPQAGRQRQFHQTGLELIGADSPSSDGEAIAIAWNLLKNLGLKNLVLELNSLGTNEDRLRYREELVCWLKKNHDLLDQDSQLRLKKNPLRILDSKNPNTKLLIKSAPNLQEFLSKESLNRFNELQECLIALKIPFHLNPSLVRGLDYYCHTAFEITSDQLGAQATVCGGGRYDNLVELLGGNPTPAIGWAFGMERLMLIIQASAIEDPSGTAGKLTTIQRPDIYLINRGALAKKTALVLTQKLRANGIVVELDFSGANFSKQFKRADKSGAEWALVIGDEEAEASEARLKNLKEPTDQKSEETFSLDNLSRIVNKISFNRTTS